MFEGLRFLNWRFERDAEGIVTLTLDRAERSVNALNRAVLDELQEIGVQRPETVAGQARLQLATSGFPFLEAVQSDWI